jgi:hypothetical protein
MVKVILYADSEEARYMALRAAEHLIAHPEKRDTIISFPERNKDFYAYRSKLGTIIARKGNNG